MPVFRRTAAFSRVSHLAEQRAVHQAFQWLHLHEPQIMRWQQEMVSIPAPPFGEEARGEWLMQRFREVGLTGVERDEAGNAIGFYRAARSEEEPTAPPSILVSAHIDTVFPPGTRIEPVLDGVRLTAPGACDNGAGVVGLLAIAAALKHARIEPPCDVLFVGNVGEEGEGDLSGIRHLYQHGRYRFAAHVVLDGAGHEVVVTAAVGSRRYLVTIEGPGGHSWSDVGRPNPIVAMSRAISRFSDLKPGAETRWNAGTIEGGTSVNSIPEAVSARFDIRSTDPEQLIRREVEFYRAFEDAVNETNSKDSANKDAANKDPANKMPNQQSSEARSSSTPRPSIPLRLSIQKIGDRPAGKLPEDAAILETLRAVDRHLGIRTEERMASTDANIPLSLGMEAISIGAGGEGGGVHTSGEWYEAHNRELALRRILLLVLALATPR